MEKSTIYIIAAIILSVTILGVVGEYLTYKYSLAMSQQLAQTQQPTIQSSSDSIQNPSTNSNTSQAQSGSSANLLISFDFNTPMAIGTVNELNHSVVITVPPDTDVTKLSPTVEISQYATVSPASGVVQDFTNPVGYTVTAQNGATQKYTVTVNVASILTSAEKQITSFKLLGFKPEVDGYIDNDNYAIVAVVPDGTDITKIIPTITVSNGAKVFPASGVAQNFSSSVIYSVTNVYGNVQKYTITVVTESNSG